MSLPKVNIEMGQDGETYIMTVNIGEGVSIEVDLEQRDIDHLKRLLTAIEKVWGKNEVMLR
jgi:hypothetical protein